jgi:hypothetical protein
MIQEKDNIIPDKGGIIHNKGKIIPVKDIFIFYKAGMILN